MSFEDQTPEMKHLFLRAAIGEVAMEAHALELQLKLALCLLNSKTGVEYEKECRKIRTLSPILDALKAKNVFSEQEMRTLEEAKKARNDFTHRLSDVYTSSIKSGSPKFELFNHFHEIRKSIEAATRIAESKMHNIAEAKGLDVAGILQSADEYIDNWI